MLRNRARVWAKGRPRHTPSARVKAGTSIRALRSRGVSLGEARHHAWPHAGGSMTPLERNLSQSRLGLQVVLELVIIMTHLSCFSI